MNTFAQVGRLKLSFNPSFAPAQMPGVLARVQELPSVLGIKTDSDLHQVEIVFREPTDGFLRSIHAALRPVNSEKVVHSGSTGGGATLGLS